MSYALERERTTIAALQLEAEEAGKRAWSLGCHNQGAAWLSRDLATTKRHVKALLACKPPRTAEAEQLLREAIERWGGITPEPTDGLARMAQLGIPVVIAPPAPTPAQILARLAALGVVPSIDEYGEARWLEFGTLTDAQRTEVKELVATLPRPRVWAE
jgi:hypothetical protein